MGTSQSSVAPSTEPAKERPNLVTTDVKTAAKESSSDEFSVSPPPLTAAKPREDAIDNPGDFEEIGKRVKDNLPVAFEGFKLIMNKGLSRFFQTSHTLTLTPDGSKAQYQFGGMYVGSKKIGENEYRPLCVGDISTNGNFMLAFAHQVTEGLKCRMNVQTQDSKWSVYQAQGDYCGSDFTASAIVANPDPIDGSLIVATQYLQSMTPKLSLGAEFMLQRSQGIEGGILSLGGRYTTEKWEAAAKVGLLAWDVSYIHKVNNSLTLVSNLEGSSFQEDSKMTAGYVYELPESNVSFKGSVCTNWTVTGMLEKKLDPLPGALVLTGQLDHAKKDYKFGIGFSIG